MGTREYRKWNKLRKRFKENHMMIDEKDYDEIQRKLARAYFSIGLLRALLEKQSHNMPADEYQLVKEVDKIVEEDVYKNIKRGE